MGMPGVWDGKEDSVEGHTIGVKYVQNSIPRQERETAVEPACKALQPLKLGWS